jgi:hypothetical protein
VNCVAYCTKLPLVFFEPTSLKIEISQRPYVEAFTLPSNKIYLSFYSKGPQMFMAKFHICYCGLVREPHVQKHSKWYRNLLKFVCNFYSAYSIYKRRLIQHCTSWCAAGLPVIYSTFVCYIYALIKSVFFKIVTVQQSTVKFLFWISIRRQKRFR